MLTRELLIIDRLLEQMVPMTSLKSLVGVMWGEKLDVFIDEII